MQIWLCIFRQINEFLCLSVFLSVKWSREPQHIHLELVVRINWGNDVSVAWAQCLTVTTWQLLWVLLLWFFLRYQRRGGISSVVLNSLGLVILKEMWQDPSYWQHFDHSFQLPTSLSHCVPARHLHCVQKPNLNSSGEHTERFVSWTYPPPFCFI